MSVRVREKACRVFVCACLHVFELEEAHESESALLDRLWEAPVASCQEIRRASRRPLLRANYESGPFLRDCRARHNTYGDRIVQLTSLEKRCVRSRARAKCSWALRSPCARLRLCDLYVRASLRAR
eukprot:6209427-Pleurochrysis_carterae.AAC.3